MSDGPRGSVHPDQKDDGDSVPEINDSRPVDEDPEAIMALAHERQERMMKEGMKSAKTRMSRIEEEEDNEGRLSQS